MIEGVSHITLVVKNIDRTTELYQELFQAKVVYDSGNKLHSLFKERFFMIGNQWIAVMESPDIINRTYHHIAFKILDSDVDFYQNKIKALKLESKPPRERISGEGFSFYFYDYDNNLFEFHTGTLKNRLSSYSAVDKE